MGILQGVCSLGHETRGFLRSRKERILAAKMPKEYGRKVGDSRDVEKIFYRLFVPITIRRHSRLRKIIAKFLASAIIHLNRHRSFSTVSPTEHQGSGYLETTKYLLEFMCMNSQLTYSVLFG